MLSALCVLLLAVDAPTPPIPPKHPDEPVVAKPEDGGTAKDATAREAAVKAAADQAPKAPAEPATSKEGGGKEEVGKKALPPPPALTSESLCAELQKQANGRKAEKARLDAERKALNGERKKLEAKAEEIENARAQLKAETERLEQLLDQAGKAGLGAPSPVKAGTTGRAQGNAPALAKTIKSMKPPQAAALVSKLDVGLAARVLQLMSAKDSGAVLAAVKPELAAELVTAMSTLAPVDTKSGRRP